MRKTENLTDEQTAMRDRLNRRGSKIKFCLPKVIPPYTALMINKQLLRAILEMLPESSRDCHAYRLAKQILDTPK